MGSDIQFVESKTGAPLTQKIFTIFSPPVLIYRKSFCTTPGVGDSWVQLFKALLAYYIQSTLVISTSVISNNRSSRRENLVLVLTQKSKIRLQNIVEKRRNCSWGAISPLFHNIFNIYF